jgi:hypothetical protein
MKRCAIFAHVDPDMDGDTSTLLSTAFERDVKSLDSGLKHFSGEGKTGGLQPVGSVIAALGAAERMM